jgi:KDO2-lipid IV(A) lauroyltransferase
MDIKSRVILAGMALMGLLTLRGARRLGALIAWFMRKTNSNAYKVTKKNLELCYPQMTEVEREKIARDSLYHAGCTIAEMGIAWGGSERRRVANRQLVKRVVNKELLDEALAEGKGVLILTTHYGNWEFYAGILPEFCGETLALYKSPGLPLLEERMSESRGASGLKLVAGGREGVQEFIKFYRAGKSCIIVPDQEPSPKSGVWSTYFGMPALTPKFINYLVKKNPEGRILISHIKRVDDGFEANFAEPDPEIYSKDLEVSAAAMNRSFERKINEDGTAQYAWNYKRFKKNPEKFYRNL